MTKMSRSRSNTQNRHLLHSVKLSSQSVQVPQHETTTRARLLRDGGVVCGRGGLYGVSGTSHLGRIPSPSPSGDTFLVFVGAFVCPDTRVICSRHSPLRPLLVVEETTHPPSCEEPHCLDTFSPHISPLRANAMHVHRSAE